MPPTGIVCIRITIKLLLTFTSNTRQNNNNNNNNKKKETIKQNEIVRCIVDQRIKSTLLKDYPLNSAKQNCAYVCVGVCGPFNITEHIMLHLPKNGLPCQ